MGENLPPPNACFDPATNSNGRSGEVWEIPSGDNRFFQFNSLQSGHTCDCLPNDPGYGILADCAADGTIPLVVNFRGDVPFFVHEYNLVGGMPDGSPLQAEIRYFNDYPPGSTVDSPRGFYALSCMDTNKEFYVFASGLDATIYRDLSQFNQVGIQNTATMLPPTETFVPTTTPTEYFPPTPIPTNTPEPTQYIFPTDTQMVVIVVPDSTLDPNSQVAIPTQIIVESVQNEDGTSSWPDIRTPDGRILYGVMCVSVTGPFILVSLIVRGIASRRRKY